MTIAPFGWIDYEPPGLGAANLEAMLAAAGHYTDLLRADVVDGEALPSGLVSSVGASSGTVPVANGSNGFTWQTPSGGGGGTVTSVTAGDGTITIGGTSGAPTVKVSAGEFDPIGTAATQVAAELTRALAAEALLAPSASPTLTGTPIAPTQSANDNSTRISTTAYADRSAANAVSTEVTRATTAEALLAPKASPSFTGTSAFTGTVTVPTVTTADSTTKVASTALVDAKIAAIGGGGATLNGEDGSINATAYGALVNGRRLDYVTASATTTAVSVGNSQTPFTSADIGKAVIVFSDTAAGVPGTITATPTSSSITVSVTGGLALSGASTGCFMIYGTDDTAAINTAATTAAALVQSDLTLGSNESVGLGQARVRIPAHTPGSCAVVTGQLTIPSSVVLDSDVVIANLQSNTTTPVITFAPYSGFVKLRIDCCFGSGIRMGPSTATAQSDTYGDKLIMWHVGKSTGQVGLALVGNSHLLDLVWMKGGYNGISHNVGGDCTINRAFIIGAVQPIIMTQSNQVAYGKIVLDSCGIPTTGGTSGLTMDNAVSDVTFNLQAFEVTGVSPARILDNVVLIGNGSTNKCVDIRGEINAQLTGGNVLKLAAAQDVMFDIVGSNTATPSSGGSNITNGVVWGASGVAGACDIRAVYSGSVTPSSGTIGGRYTYEVGGVTTVADQSITFTTSPAVPTTTTSDSTTKAASTALVDAKIAAAGGGGGGTTNLLSVFNVKTTYGATGNGTTDDSTAIQAAITAATAAGGGIVFFPPGTYLCGSITPASKVHFLGAGVGASILKQSTTKTSTFVSTGVGASLISEISWTGLTFQGTLSIGSGFGIEIYDNVSDVRIQDCEFDSYSWSGIYLRGIQRAWIDRNRMTNIGTAAETNVIDIEIITPPDTATNYNFFYIRDNYINGSPTVGIDVLSQGAGTTTRSVISGNIVLNCDYGIATEANGTNIDNIITDNHVFACTTYAILAQNTGTTPGGATITDTNALKNMVIANNNVDCLSSSLMTGIGCSMSNAVVSGNVIRASGYGIYLGGDAGSTRRAHSQNIVDNVITIVGSNEAIYSTIADYSVLAGNITYQEDPGDAGGRIHLSGGTDMVVRNNYLYIPGGMGIQCSGTPNAKVYANVLIDPNSNGGSGASGAGIEFDGSIGKSHAFNNIVHDTRGTPQTTYGVIANGITGTLYSNGNTSIGATTNTSGTTAATVA